MKTKTIIPIAVVAIFVTLAFAPAVSAAGEKQTLNLTWIPLDDEASAQNGQVTLDETAATKFYNDITGFFEWMQTNAPIITLELVNNKLQLTITEEKMNAIKSYVQTIKDDLAASSLIQAITTEMLAECVISGLLMKRLVLAVGWGRSLMPFNSEEWGWSGGNPFKQFLTFRMTMGYMGTIHHRPLGGWTGRDLMGRFIVSVQGLNGLWIDGGSLGWERFFKSGIEVVIGRARVVSLPSIIGGH